ncbi:hypothetical protein BS614_08250 [Paenibacillus xylanexedens]|nr:hypothetical protein BS614_08250 [Paenibacillus xylanexedens]
MCQGNDYEMFVDKTKMIFERIRKWMLNISFLLCKYMVTKSRKMLNNRSFCGFIGKVNSGKEAYA